MRGAAAGLLASLLLGQSSLGAPTPAAAPRHAQPTEPAMDETAQDTLLRQALEKIAARRPAHGALAVLLLGGAGAAAPMKKRLEAALAADARVQTVTAAPESLAPVADPSTPGAHVHPIHERFSPRRPELIVHVSSANDTLWIAAHINTADPLGGPGDAGWLFVLQSPLAP